MSNHRGWLRTPSLWLLSTVAIVVACLQGTSQAADSGFNIQVSPSPLTVVLTPGQQYSAAVTVRNLSNHTETLVPHLQGFSVGDADEKINFTTGVPLGLDSWITFKQSSLTLAPGATAPLEVVYHTPKDVGFSYSLAIILSQATKPAHSQGAGIEGSVAVFNLINIDRPDAKRLLSIDNFAGASSHYEYLPAEFKIRLHNEGNVIAQPSGTLFIQRSFDDNTPIASLPINPEGRYLLPGSTRTLGTTWRAGFPVYLQDGQKQRLSWDWRHLNQLRMGKYVAKAVVVYNDGQRDVPLTSSYTFWVIPWKLLLGSVLLIVFIATGVIAWLRLLLKGTKKVQGYARRTK